MNLSRRRVLAAGSSAVLAGAIASPFVARAQQAQFTYKYANNLPETHPMNMRAREMAAAIKQETNGRFDLQIFPIEPARLRHRHAVPGPLRRRRVLHAVGPDPVDAGAAGLDQRHGLRVSKLRHGVEGDGRRSRRLCPRADREGQSARHGEDLGQRLPPDHDLDQADQDAGRLRGFKMRVPPIAAVDLDVQGLRRGAGLDQFQRSLFGAADQDRRRPGESAGDHRHRQTLRGAEILLADQSHVGRLLVPGQPASAWEALPADMRGIVAKHVNAAGAEGARRRRQAQRRPAGRTLPPRAWSSTSSIRRRSATSCASAGFYTEWKGKYGDEAWAILEKSVGKLA